MSERERCKGDQLNSLVCVRGKLFKENVATGAMEATDMPCPRCAVESVKVTMPNIPQNLVNNITMGHDTYGRPLTEVERERIRAIRDVGLEFLVMLHQFGGTDPNADRLANRRFAVAATNMEEAVMWAVKGIAQGK